jgi:hypothetical protein
MLNPCLKYVFTLVTTISNSCDIVRRLGTRYITWGNLTDLLNETAQYGNSQAVLNEYATKRQNISNFGKLVSNKVKTINMVATKGMS